MTRKKKGRVIKLRPRSSPETVWIGGRFQLPFCTTDEEPDRPEIQLWIELPDAVVGRQLVEPGDPCNLGEAILEAIEDPVTGKPRRPDLIRVATQVLAEEVRSALGDSVPISVAPTPELDEVYDFIVESLSSKPQADTFTYLEDGDVSAKMVEGLFLAAKSMKAMQLWKVFSPTQFIRLDIPELGVVGACVTVIGDVDERHGFLIFPSEAAFATFVHRLDIVQTKSDSKHKLDLGTDWISFTLESGDDISGSLLDEAEEWGWRWSEPDSFPLLRHADRDGTTRPVTVQDLDVATACAFALCSLLIRGGPEVEGLAEETVEPFSVSFHDENDREVRLTVPYGASKLFQDTPQPTKVTKRQHFKPRASRNAPCPCGSGKKYKKCHLSSDRADAERETVHERDNRIGSEIEGYASTDLDSPWWERTRDFNDPTENMAISAPWAIYEAPVDQQTPVDRYLESGRCHDPEDIAWLRAQQQSWVSVWEVVQVTPGETLEVIDSLTRETRRVHEERGSEDLQIGNLILARVVDYGGESVFVGMYPRPLLPTDGAKVVEKMRKRLRRKSAIPIERMQQFTNARYLLKVWEEAVVEMDLRRATPPALHNMDGDPLCFTKDAFTFDPRGRDAIYDAIGAVSGVDRDDDASGILLSPEPGRSSGGAEDEVHFSFLEGPKKQMAGNDARVATMRLRPDKLYIETNSTRRADRIRETIEDACGGRLQFQNREEQTDAGLRELVEQLDAVGRGLESTEAPISEENPIPVEEGRRIALSFKREHYAAWVDISLPALEGKTPREAAKSARGRQKLDVLLKEMAFSERQLDPEEAFDFEEIRRKLGLASSRGTDTWAP